MHHFISVRDVKSVQSIVQLALEIKENPFKFQKIGKRKTLGLFFFNPSLRTRLSTVKAAQYLGLQCIVSSMNQGWPLEFEIGAKMDQNKSEHIQEAAQVISQYFDIIGIRSFPALINLEEDLSEPVLSAFKKFGDANILNLESASRHPLQGLTDVMTIEEYRQKKKPKVVLTWAPHPKVLPHSVANSFVSWCKKMNYDLHIAAPEGYQLHSSIASEIPYHTQQEVALKDADFVYAKSWSSFENYGNHIPVYDDWMVDDSKMAHTNDAYFMHCLPVRRNIVVSDQVIDSKKSLVIQQANNRTYAAASILYRILKKR